MRRGLTPLLIVAVAWAVAGCGGGGGGGLSADEAAAKFEQGVSDSTEARATDVECVDASQADYFDCTGKIAGFRTKFQLKLDGDTLDIVKPADRVPAAS
jgi:hypothetical protein